MKTKKAVKIKTQTRKKSVKAKKAKKIMKAKRLVKKIKAKKAKPKAVFLRKPAKKNAAKPVRAQKSVKTKPIGTVTHFFGNIRVAIVKFNQKVPAGTALHFKGATTDFTETAKSMQYNHVSIAAAPKGKQIGIKVKKKVREGDEVYKAG